MRPLLIALAGILLALPTLAADDDKIPPDIRRFAGNFNQEKPATAYTKLESWVFAPEVSPEERARRIAVAREILVRGNYISALYRTQHRWVDPLIHKIEASEPESWRALKEAALILDSPYLTHQGALVDGEIRRDVEMGGPLRYSHQRDRFRAIDFLRRAIELCKQDLATKRADSDDLGELYLLLEESFDDSDEPSIDHLSDLQAVPDLGTRRRKSRWERQPDELLVDGRSPVLDADGRIRLPSLAASFAAAGSDLARQRWLLDETARISPAHAAEARLRLASLWTWWLGVEGLVEAGYVYIEGLESELNPQAPGEFELHTLADDETILVTRDGPKRMTIPVGFRPIEILKQVIADPSTPEEERIDAYQDLSQLLANRRQFKRYEQLAHDLVRRLPDSEHAAYLAESLLEEIAPDGRFLDIEPFVAGSKIEVEYLSRNIARITLELWQLDVEKLLSESDQATSDLGFALSTRGDSDIYERYRDRLLPYYQRIKLWTVDVAQKPNHLQSISRLPVPLTEPGHYYLVTRTSGTDCGVPITLEETLLIGTPIDADEANYLLLDSATGQPIKHAEITPLDYPSEGPVSPDHLGAFALDDSSGVFIVRRPGRPPEIKGSVEAMPDEGGPSDRMEIETLLVTNQPLYRPGQTVRFSGWLRQPGNRHLDTRRAFRETQIRLRVEDPSGRTLSTQTHPLDEFGSFSGSFTLDSEIALGSCRIMLESKGSLTNPGRSDDDDPFGPVSWAKLDTWKIEIGEFRKPDFRVEIDAAPKPGDESISATVRAFYNSGEPMIGAEVLGELEASPTAEVLFPKSEFEWLYDPGYDWPLPASKWMPDWQRWGIHHSLLGSTDEQDSFYEAKTITLETTATTDENGEARLDFRGGFPLLDHFPYDCRLRAAVREFSGRGAIASKDFLHSGRPLELFIRPDKGFYRSGEKITLQLSAMNREREPLAAEGSLRIDRLGYQVPRRTIEHDKVLEQAINIGRDGTTTLVFTPPGPGQYQCMLRSGDSRRGIVLNVLGDDFDARELRFNPLQLTPERSVCAPGDTIEVAIHCDRPDALVWLFQLMPDGRRQSPRLLQLDGKVAVVEIIAPPTGTPNFQLMAITAHQGIAHQTRCQISLPPREQILEVALAAQPANPAPGGQLDLALQVRDHLGSPTAASFALTAFDRSLEDLADPLPTTRQLMPYPFEPFWGYEPHIVANRSEYPSPAAFQQLWEPGCFSDRMDFSGKIHRGKHARFSKVGEDVWIAYEPPELPNSVGGGFSGRRDSMAGIFPVTPATPSSYSRPSGSRIDLDPDQSTALRETKARRRFADHAYWGVAIRTDAQGRAQLSFPLPENLTAWKVQAWAFGRGNQFGDAQIEVPVSKPLQLRPILPRSAVHGDHLRIAATIQNLSDRAHDFHVLLEVRDLETNLDDSPAATQVVTVPAGGEGLVWWPVELRGAGTARFHFVARATDGSLSDGTEVPLIVAPRTTPVVVAANVRVEPGQARESLTFELSGMPDEATLRVRLSAQPAIDAFAAIPELVSYPFGCTEQTLNRFLPLLVASKAVRDHGGDWEALLQHVAVRDHALGWIRGRPSHHVEPINKPLTHERTDIIIHAGLKRLDDMADNNAWGWFPGTEASPYLTALVVRGFAIAEGHGYKLPERTKLSSNYWLEGHARNRASSLAATTDPEIAPEDPFVVYALSLGSGDDHLGLQKLLLKRSDELSLSGRIFLALSLDADHESKLLRRIDREMATLDDQPSFYTRWWQDPVETRAWYLMLLTHRNPSDPLIPDQIDRLLSLRANGVTWKSTRDTALCIEAIAGTLTRSDLQGNSAAPIPLEIEVAGKHHPVSLNRENFRTAEVILPLRREQLTGDQLAVTIHRAGTEGPRLRVAAAVRYDADAAKVTAASTGGLLVHRNYYLLRSNGDRIPVTDQVTLTAGDVVEVELKVQAPQPRDFVHLSDPIPAGLEPLHQLSGYQSGAYRESRSGETHLFITRLTHWNNTFRYRCHAVTPGTSIALPARAECMYAPDIFGATPTATLKIHPRP